MRRNFGNLKFSFRVCDIFIDYKLYMLFVLPISLYKQICLARIQIFNFLNAMCERKCKHFWAPKKVIQVTKTLFFWIFVHERICVNGIESHQAQYNGADKIKIRLHVRWLFTYWDATYKTHQMCSSFVHWKTKHTR